MYKNNPHPFGRARLRSLVAALLLLPLLAGFAMADDVVVLKDGSRILGNIVGMSDGSLTIEGGAAGKVTIPFSSVKSLSTTTEHKIVLADGSVVVGRFTLGENDTPEFGTDASSQSIDYGRIAAVNPPEKAPINWDGSVTLSGKVVDGNSQKKSVTAGAELTRRSEDDRILVLAEWNYSEDEGNVSERNAAGLGKYDYFITEKLFAYANAGLQGDKFADLNLRTSIGAGAGYQFVEDAKYKFYEEVGVSYVDEDFDVGKDDDYTAARFSGKFDWVIEEGRITFFHFHTVLMSLDDTDDVLVETRTGIRLTVIANFFANFQVNYSWDNTPSAGAERTDTEYLVGLGYSFTF